MKNTDDLTGWFLGVLICGLALTPPAMALITANSIDDVNPKDITIKEAPLLGAEVIKKNTITNDTLSFLKLDVNKNGVFDNEDIVIITDTENLSLEKNKNIVYFENKKSNKNGMVAYQNKDDEYILNRIEITENIRKKYIEYMENNNQR